MSVNLSSLKNESVDRLEDAGFFSVSGSGDGYENEPPQGASLQTRQGATIGEGREVNGAPWFEEMIEGSELGRLKRRRGGGRSADGRTIVEYEVTEFESGNEDHSGTGSAKRKIGSLGDGEGHDAEMRSG